MEWSGGAVIRRSDLQSTVTAPSCSVDNVGAVMIVLSELFLPHSLLQLYLDAWTLMMRSCYRVSGLDLSFSCVQFSCLVLTRASLRCVSATSPALISSMRVPLPVMFAVGKWHDMD